MRIMCVMVNSDNWSCDEQLFINRKHLISSQWILSQVDDIMEEVDEVLHNSYC